MQKNRRPTLQDVAELVGVTKMTVSRYLRNPERVAKETGKRIQLAVNDLGYVPNRVPDILSNGASRTIGVVVPSMKHPVFQYVIEGIEAAAEASGYEVMLAHSGFELDSEEQRIQTLLSFNVDGLILAESHHSQRSLRMIETAGIPFIDVLDAEEGEESPRVGIDNELAALSMVALMIERGYKKIVCLSARKGIQTDTKIKGYIAAMEEEGLVPKSLSAKSESSVSLARKMMRKVLDRYPETDAVFCTDDELAAGVLLECQNQDISVPEEMGIAGVHALDIGQSMMPRVASIVTPDRETGEKATYALLEMIQGNTTQSLSLDFEIDEGETLVSP
ncbi:transcriptional regulator [Enterovibrio coralii]|uniref:Transcriptional regulator n=2 Tax=Enterovibrio coralii TaxID=294935 RepID=A0A135I533_9GAMM|nr:transcriptional regulator [Enterovibrio coralii]